MNVQFGLGQLPMGGHYRQAVTGAANPRFNTCSAKWAAVLGDLDNLSAVHQTDEYVAIS